MDARRVLRRLPRFQGLLVAQVAGRATSRHVTPVHTLAMKLTLPYPPSSNRRLTMGGGRMRNTDVYKAYRQEAELRMNQMHLECLEGDVALTLHYYRSTMQGDLDNLLKVVIDVMQGYCYFDDRQVRDIHAVMHEDKIEEPRVEVEVTAATAPVLPGSPQKGK